MVIDEVNVTEVPWQNGLAEGVIMILAGREGEIVIVIGLDIAGLPYPHAILDVSLQVIMSPFTKELVVYVRLFPPTMVPPTFHSYIGADPAFTGVAVNITDVPEQTGFSEATIETLTGVFLLADIIIGVEFIGFGLEHQRLEVTLQVT